MGCKLGGHEILAAAISYQRGIAKRAKEERAYRTAADGILAGLFAPALCRIFEIAHICLPPRAAAATQARHACGTAPQRALLYSLHLRIAAPGTAARTALHARRFARVLLHDAILRTRARRASALARTEHHALRAAFFALRLGCALRTAAGCCAFLTNAGTWRIAPALQLCMPTTSYPMRAQHARATTRYTLPPGGCIGAPTLPFRTRTRGCLTAALLSGMFICGNAHALPNDAAHKDVRA